jgi:transcriptional regulator with XRE-family HTH domain
MNNLNKILKHIRAFNKLTQQQLEEKTGIDRAYISEIENGKKTPSLKVLGKYSVAFKIPLSTILLFAENYEEKVGFKNVMKKRLTETTLKFLNWIVKE